MVDTVDKVIIEYKSENFDKTAGDVKQLSGNLEGLTQVSFSAEKSTASLENKFASLERRFQTSAAQSAQYEKIQKDVNLAVANNPALQDRANEVLKAAEARYLGAGTAVKALAEAHKGLDAQGQAALHSVRSVVEQLALGIPPTQALTGQLNHLTFAATGEGGLAGAFKQVGGLIGGLITPTTAAIGATLALGAAAAALAVQYDKVQVSSQRALIGAGGRTGTSVSDLNTFTSDNSGLAGTGLSAKEARGLGEDFTRTGEIVISRLHGMSDAVVGFANQTGKSIDEAKKDLVGFAVDPQKGMDELAKTFGSFDVATRKAVEALVLADDKTGAFQVVIDALGEKSKKAADNMGFFEKATRSVVNLLATETVKPSGLESQLSAAQAKLAAAQSSPDMGGFGQENIKNLTKNVDDLQKAMDKVNAQKAAAEISKLSTDADAADRALIPQIAHIEQLKLAIERLEQAKAAGATSRYGASVDDAALQAAQNQLKILQESEVAAASYNDYIKQVADSYVGVSTNAALQLSALNDQLKVLKAHTEQQKLSAQYAKDYNDLRRSGSTAEDAAAIASAKRANSEEAAHQSALAWQQDMLGVSDKAIQAANAAQSAAEAWQKANDDAFNAVGGNFGQSGGFGSPSGDSGKQYTSTSNLGYAIIQHYDRIKSASDLANITLGSSGVDAAIAAAQGVGPQSTANKTYGNKDFSAYGFANKISDSDTFGAVQALYELKNAQTTDKSAKIANLQQEMAFFQSQPETIARDQVIVNLQHSIDQLKQSTDANTAATSATLNPLYSQGHGALAIGYYKAAGGLDMVAQGPTSGDQIPFHAMINGGERVQITPQNQISSNDNGRPSTVQNVYIDQRGVKTSNARRNMRQFAQGLGQVAAAGN